MVSEYNILNNFGAFLIVTIVGLSTSICQRLATYKYKDNVDLDTNHLAIELSICIVAFLFQRTISRKTESSTFSEECSRYLTFSEEEI